MSGIQDIERNAFFAGFERGFDAATPFGLDMGIECDPATAWERLLMPLPHYVPTPYELARRAGGLSALTLPG